MITAIVGTPGSGKSLKAAYDIIFDLKHGHNVITNFKIEPEKYFGKRRISKYTYFENYDMSVCALIRYCRKYHLPGKEHQTTLYLDEPDFFDSRNLKSEMNKKWIKFLRLHRKLGFDVVIVTQDLAFIDPLVVKCIESYFQCCSLKHYKNLGFILSLFFGGNIFFANEYWRNKKIRLSTTMYRLNRKKARIYDTFNTFCSFEELLENF